MDETKNIRLEVKYFPPALMKKLAFICNYPLTLLEASSGFGKTTASIYFFDEIVPKTAEVYRHIFIENEIKKIY